MKIGKFVYESGFTVYGRIVVYAHTENRICRETHKVYDSCHPKFQGKAIPDWIMEQEFTGIGPADDGISIHYNTEEIIPSHKYL